MKKKIKDLNKKECYRICKQQSCCEDCPLLVAIDTQTHFVSCYYDIVCIKEREVEIDEN